MGKKKKDNPLFGHYASGNYKKEKAVLDRYGVEGVSFGGKPGNYGSAEDRGVRTADTVKDELTKAASQDYDTRRTLEAAALSGKKKAQKILDSGFKSTGDIMNAQNFFKKAAKRHGQGGEFSNVSDFMGLTQSMVERDRRKLNESIDDRIAAGQKKDTPLDKAKATFDRGSTNTLSPEAAKAYGTVQAYESRARGEGDYSFTDARFGDSSTQEAAAQELADAYKAGVKKRLSPDFKMDRVFT